MGRKLLMGLVLIAPLGFYPFLRNTGAPLPVEPIPTPAAYQPTHDQQIAMQCFTAFPGLPFPSNLPWDALRKIGEDETKAMRELAAKDPVAFLEKCLVRYERDVQGYRCTFLKQERVNGTLRDPERIIAHFRATPFSVHMEWKEGIDKCFASYYVEGENVDATTKKSLLRARPSLFGIRGPIVSRPPDAPDAKATSRFPITRFGLYAGAKSTIDAAHAARQRDALHLAFKGVEPVEKLGGRLCYKFLRTPYEPPEEDGIAEMTIYIDQETLLQTGSVLLNAEKELIAEYFFRDVEINPKFDPKQFTDKAL